MASDLAVVTRTGIFCGKNLNKVDDGQIGRGAVFAGQGKKVLDYVSTLDNKLGEGSREAIDIMRKAADNEALLKYAGKAVDFASKNVNPLICASAGIDVLTSDDKESALVTNTTALAAMFAVESQMKKHLDDIPKLKCFEGISEKILKSIEGTKAEGKLPAIIHGVAFVIGSGLAYSAGEKFGKLLVGKPSDDGDTQPPQENSDNIS